MLQDITNTFDTALIFSAAPDAPGFYGAAEGGPCGLVDGDVDGDVEAGVGGEAVARVSDGREEVEASRTAQVFAAERRWTGGRLPRGLG